MERQLFGLNAAFSSQQDGTSFSNQRSYPSQIMSCPDLDSFDHFFGDFNNSPNSHFQPPHPTHLLEGAGSYLVNYDIYGRMILDSSNQDSEGTIGSYDAGNTEECSGDEKDSWSQDRMIEEDNEEVTAWNIDKENMDPTRDFTPRRRAQSECFGSLLPSSRPRARHGIPLKDITPAPAKKDLAGSSGNKKVSLQYIQNMAIRTPGQNQKGSSSITLRLR